MSVLWMLHTVYLQPYNNLYQKDRQHLLAVFRYSHILLSIPLPQRNHQHSAQYACCIDAHIPDLTAPAGNEQLMEFIRHSICGAHCPRKQSGQPHLAEHQHRTPAQHQVLRKMGTLPYCKTSTACIHIKQRHQNLHNDVALIARQIPRQRRLDEYERHDDERCD